MLKTWWRRTHICAGTIGLRAIGSSTGARITLRRHEQRHRARQGRRTFDVVNFSTTARRHRHSDSDDPRLRSLGRQIADDYAALRDDYIAPKHPIVLAHGLLGFAELHITNVLPAVQYWHGIQAALESRGARVIAASVPPSSAIEERAAKLSADIAALVSSSSSSSTTNGEVPTVNIIAHSMGGLDARHMIAHCPPPGVRIASLVTVATPHRGSAFADYLLPNVPQDSSGGTSSSTQATLPLVHLSRLYGLLERAGLGTGAFAQLTTRHMTRTFNPATPDRPDVRYFSFGATCPCPPLLSPFRHSWRVVTDAEGPNDGLVSVESSRWGAYRGTLVNVSHLDLINWSNRLRWTLRQWMGMKKTFNAVAFYLDIADMLAKEGL